MIKLQAKRFDLNFLLKFSDLKSNFTLSLGYLNPVLNNRGLVCKSIISLPGGDTCPTQITPLDFVRLPYYIAGTGTNLLYS